MEPTISHEDEADHFSLDAARAFLQSMRKTYTSGSGYYDKSLLEDPKEIPLRSVAPNEFNQVDPENTVPRARETNINLTDFQDKDPGANEDQLSNIRPSASTGDNPNIDGVHRTLSGDLDELSSGSGDHTNQKWPSASPANSRFVPVRLYWKQKWWSFSLWWNWPMFRSLSIQWQQNWGRDWESFMASFRQKQVYSLLFSNLPHFQKSEFSKVY